MHATLLSYNIDTLQPLYAQNFEKEKKKKTIERIINRLIVVYNAFLICASFFI